MSTLREIVDSVRASVRDQVRSIIDRDDALALLLFMEKHGFVAKDILDGLGEAREGRIVHPRFLKHKEMTTAQASSLEGVEQADFQREYSNWLETEPGVVVELRAQEAEREAKEAAKPRGKGDEDTDEAKANAASVSAASVEIAKNPRHISIDNPNTDPLTPIDTSDKEQPTKLGSGPKTKEGAKAEGKARDAKAASDKGAGHGAANAKAGKPSGGGTMKASDMIR